MKMLRGSLVAPVLIILLAGVVYAGPAPPLTRVQVEKVTSTKVPAGETIPPYAVATTKDHGGPLLRVQVIEYGYGQYESATFNGTPMKKISETEVLNKYRQVIGFRLIYELKKPYTTGEFKFRATTMVHSPYYPMTQSVKLTIR